ncbi:MAG: TIGR04255 family protein [Candidatus Nanopelagicales bacterium]
MKMDKPSLVFVIAAARFAQAPLDLLHDADRTSQFRSAIQRPLAAAGLSQVDVSKGRQFNIAANANGELQVNAFEASVLTAADPSKQVAVTVDPGGISVRATADAYVTHEWLFGLLDIALGSLAASAPEVRYARLGLRYLDLVLPAEQHDVSDYLSGPFAVDMSTAHVPSQMNLEEYVQVAVLSQPKSRARLVAKCFRGSGKVQIPADMADAVVVPALPDAPSGFALLDIDHFIEAASPAETMGVDDLRAELTSLHQGVRDVFVSLLSDHAKTEWGVTE